MASNHPRRGPGGPGGGPGGYVPGEKAKNFKGTIRKMIHYIGSYHAAVVCVALFAIGGTIFNIVGPKVLGQATTELANGLMAKIGGTGGIGSGRGLVGGRGASRQACSSGTGGAHGTELEEVAA